MPYGFRKKNGYRKNYTKKVVSKATAAARTKAFNLKVRRVLDRTRERKLKVFNLINTGNIKGSGIKWSDNTKTTHSGIVVAPLSLAAIAQGTEQEQRIGNKISNCSLTVKGIIHSLEYDSVLNNSRYPFEVVMVAYKNKYDRSGAFDNLTIELNNQTGMVTGSGLSQLRPFNRDTYIIKVVKRWKLNALAEVVNTTGNSSLMNPNVGFNSVARRFACRIPIAKNLMFRDESNTPENDWVHIGMYVVPCDGQELDYSIERCQVQMDGYLSYTDA